MPRWLTQRELRAWRGLQFMNMRIEGELACQLAADSELSYPDYRVLAALTDQPEGTMRLFELGAVLGWEKSRLSHHLARMADRGLVEKRPCEIDRRGAYVSVTKKGRREIEAAAPGHVAAVRRLFVDQLSPDQLDAVAEIAETVLTAFDGAQDPSALEGGAARNRGTGHGILADTPTTATAAKGRDRSRAS